MTAPCAIHTHCRACSTPLPAAFLDLGEQPLANNLCLPYGLGVMAEHHDATFPMRLARCPRCGLLQLDCVVDPAAMFSHYLYTPSQSKKTLEHFSNLARAATERMGGPMGLAVDVGSNDGALLGYLKAHGWSVCGIDPAVNLAAAANAVGLPTLVGFFSKATAEAVVAKHGRARLLTANNVFAHTPDWAAFIASADVLLADDGLIAIEFPYGPTMLQDGTFDLIYFEHASYPALGPVQIAFARAGFVLRDVEWLPTTHGGSVRVWLGRSGEATASVRELLAIEATSYSAAACVEFIDRVAQARLDLAEAVRAAAAGGGRVLGYTAPAKCVTLLVAAGLGRTDVSHIIDDNPRKQGRLLPVLHIPVISEIEAGLRASDTVVIFAWNVAEDIMARLPPGVSVIIPMPSVRTLRR